MRLHNIGGRLHLFHCLLSGIWNVFVVGKYLFNDGNLFPWYSISSRNWSASSKVILLSALNNIRCLLSAVRISATNHLLSRRRHGEVTHISPVLSPNTYRPYRMSRWRSRDSFVVPVRRTGARRQTKDGQTDRQTDDKRIDGQTSDDRRTGPDTTQEQEVEQPVAV